MKPNKIYKRSFILAMALVAVFALAAAWPCTASGQSYAILHTFTCPPSNPYGGVIQGTDGNFYGTTQQGGTPGQGTAFKMDPSGTVTILHSFTGPDGVSPNAALVQGSDGNLYGTTSGGGPSGGGTVFKLSPDGILTTLHAFNGSDGASPQAALLQGSDGSLYGTTDQGGTSNKGTVFKIGPDGTFATLHAFTGSAPAYDGASPRGALLQGGDGSLYGTTYQGGFFNAGTVFKLAPDGTLTTLHAFTTSGHNGYNPSAGLLQLSDGNLYGTTSRSADPSEYGTVFKLAPNGLGFSTLHTFGGSDGTSPQALLQGIDGNLYGTTAGGGPSGNGTVFKLAPDATGGFFFTTLHAFSGSDGALLRGALFQGSDSNLYATTSQGGPSGGGTVFKLGLDGTLSMLHAFLGGDDGDQPVANLLQGSNGNLYGTTFLGGASRTGTVFALAPDGSGFSTLHTFLGDSGGAYPLGGLLEGSDGNLYGTTNWGGFCPDYSCGTVFKLAPDGTLTTLHYFSRSDGALPRGGLLQRSDGNLYGTTSYGGASDEGTVFKLAPDGTLTTLHAFSGSDGAYPFAGLLQGSDGNLYGTTDSGGSCSANVTYGCGTVFTLAPNGSLTTLHAFNGSDGAYPFAGLLQGSDGNLYGTTSRGGASDVGTVFKLAPDGTLTTLHAFSGGDGAWPEAGLLQGSDGNLYGTTDSGGVGGLGVVFRLQPPETLTVSLAGAGSGTVTSEPAGISCPGTCSAAFPIGTLVTLTATPAAGSAFTGWNGARAGTGSCSLELSSDMAVTARFSPAYTITASAGPNGSISPSGAVIVTQGDNQSFTIAPNPGYLVLNVLVDGCPVGALTTYNFLDVQANHAIAASFALSWSGVLQPIDPPNGNGVSSSVFKAGSTVPVKFALTGASAGITTLAATLSCAKVSNGVVGTDLEAVSTAAATTGNQFRYDAATGQYMFNWSTRGLTSGMYRLFINLGDGVSRTVDIGLK
jgi:uncharacterized repeat protein (TIGR03803 family)